MGNIQCNACNCNRHPEKEDEINQENHKEEKTKTDNTHFPPQWENNEESFLPSKAKHGNINMMNYINTSEDNMESKEFGDNNTNGSVNDQAREGREINSSKSINSGMNNNINSQMPTNEINVKRGSKIFTNLNNSKAPLEIINELNGELSKDSIRENVERISEKEIQMSQSMKETVLKMLDEKERKLKSGGNTIVSTSGNVVVNQKASKTNTIEPTNTVISRLVSGVGTVSNSEYSSEQNAIRFGKNKPNSDCLNTIDTVVQVDYIANETEGKEQITESRLDTNQNKLTIERGGQGKIQKKSSPRNKKEAWRDILVTSIIPENKLLNSDNEDMLFQGELMKFTPVNPAQHGANPYSSKFCIITRTEFKAYRSKESFLRMQTPNYKIPFFNILATNSFNLEAVYQLPNTKAKKYFHLFIEIFSHSKDIRLYSFNGNINVNNVNLALPGGKPNFDSSISKIGTDSEIMDNGRPSKRGKKMSMIDDKSESLIIKELDSKNIDSTVNNININSPNMLIFASESEELINKWLCVINYFISK